MGRKKAAFYFSLSAGALVLALSVVGFVRLLGRPQVPWDALAVATGIPGERLPLAVVRADGSEVRDHVYDFNFITARHKIGDPVEFVVDKDGREEVVRERLVPYYANGTFPVVYLLTGAFGFMIGLVVLVLRPEDRRARIFFWLCVAFSSAVMISGDWYGVQGQALFIIPGVAFFFAYALTPAFLFRFSLSFTPQGRASGFPALWAVSLVFGAFFSALLSLSLILPSIGIFRLKKYFSVFRLYFLALCVAAVVALLRSYRASISRERRAQIKWVLTGLAVGLGPFLFLYQLPRSLDLPPLLGEEAASAFFVLLPIAIAFAILKYKLMDVDLIINRSLVYSLLTMVTVGVYLLTIEGLKQLFTESARPGRAWIPVGAAVIAAIAFAPARNRIQVLVDKAFFRRGYDYRRAVFGFTTAAGQAYSAGDLMTLLENTLAETLPVGRFGALVLEPGEGPPRIKVRKGIDAAAAAALLGRLPGPGALWPGETLATAGFEAASALPPGAGPTSGWIFIGRKRSGLEFTDEDRELLESLAVETASALRRIRLQEEVAYERASREKSEEVSRLKTEFISSVSHELRTPMTSLQSISRLLQSGKIEDASRREHLLELMAGECGRLGRFLHNVLDFGKIEQNAKHYEFRATDLKPLVAEVAEIVRSAASGDDLDLVVGTPEGPVALDVDADSVRQALLNLADNAIKYSDGPKRVVIRLDADADEAVISVSDRGIGIPAGDLENVFAAFFRSPAAVRHDPKGVGLGLKIVKHIMDAHGGAVDIASEPGQGTVVTLKFPKRRRT
jgi:signal transduction histidine kinase